jgi:hypothetical protein
MKYTVPVMAPEIVSTKATTMPAMAPSDNAVSTKRESKDSRFESWLMDPSLESNDSASTESDVGRSSYV